jgi:prepilin-type N-terminal cleavage/methylation domain-containing protein
MYKHFIAERGFTLIELLIALFISVVIGVATIGFMVYSQKSHAVQEQVADTQQNVRIAMVHMVRDLRLAGNWNNVFFDDATLAVHLAHTAALAITPGLDACGNCANYGVTAWKAATDAIRVVYADNNCPDSFLVDRPGASDPANSFFLCMLNPLPAKCNAGNGFPFQPNDLVLVVGDLGSTFIQVSTINAVGGTVGCGSGYTRVRVTYPPGQSAVNDPNGIAEVGENPRAHRVSTSAKIYYVDPNGNLRYRDGSTPDENPGVILAANVEDLQVSYMLRDGTIVHNPAQGDVGNIRNVRLNLLACTANPDPLLTSTRPALENHEAGNDRGCSSEPGAVTPPGYRRRLLQEEVRVRNLMD